MIAYFIAGALTLLVGVVLGASLTGVSKNRPSGPPFDGPVV